MSHLAAEPARVFHVEHAAGGSRAAFEQATRANPAMMADMDLYLRMLTDASQEMNLVGPSALAEFWTRHALDSAQLLPLMGGERRVVDIGSGAGLPGLVLAVLLKETPGARVHLIESLAKRGRFLRSVVDALALPAELHVGRAEALPSPPIADLVTARACAPLTRLLHFAEPWLSRGAIGLFLKGRRVEMEIEEARRSWSFRSTLLPSASDESGRVLKVEDVRRARR